MHCWTQESWKELVEDAFVSNFVAMPETQDHHQIVPVLVQCILSIVKKLNQSQLKLKTLTEGGI